MHHLPRDWGFGCLVMANAYAYRSTDPKGLWSVDDPVGPENNDALQSLAQMAGMVSWPGASIASQSGRSRCWSCSVVRFIAWERQRRGFPKHPLYIARSQKPVEFPV